MTSVKSIAGLRREVVGRIESCESVLKAMLEEKDPCVDIMDIRTSLKELCFCRSLIDSLGAGLRGRLKEPLIDLLERIRCYKDITDDNQDSLVEIETTLKTLGVCPCLGDPCEGCDGKIDLSELTTYEGKVISLNPCLMTLVMEIFDLGNDFVFDDIPDVMKELRRVLSGSETPEKGLGGEGAK